MIVSSDSLTTRFAKEKEKLDKASSLQEMRDAANDLSDLTQECIEVVQNLEEMIKAFTYYL